MGVFLMFFTPGTNVMHRWNEIFERESSKYSLQYRQKLDPWFEGDEEEDIVFMRVHCRKHLNFCMNKLWNGRIYPYAEAYTLDEEGNVQVQDYNDWHRSPQGIKGFFKSIGFIEDDTDPE